MYLLTFGLARRMRYNLSMDIEALKTTLHPFFARRAEVHLAYLFGSVAQGRTNKLSDIDIALLVDEKKFKKLDAKEPYGYKAAMIADLMGLLHKNEIDLVLLHEAPPLLAHEVIRSSIVLFSRNENERIAFEVSAKKRYLDTKKLRAIQWHYLAQRIDAGRLGGKGDRNDYKQRRFRSICEADQGVPGER